MQNLTAIRFREVHLEYQNMQHLPLLRISVRNTDERIHRSSSALRAMVPGVAFYPWDVGNILPCQTILPPAVKTLINVSSRWAMSAQPWLHMGPIQGYLGYEKTPPPRTLQ